MPFRGVITLNPTSGRPASAMVAAAMTAALAGCLCWNCVPPGGTVGRFDVSGNVFATELLVPADRGGSDAGIAVMGGMDLRLHDDGWLLRPRFVGDDLYYVRNKEGGGSVLSYNFSSGDSSVVYTSDAMIRDFLVLPDQSLLVAELSRGGARHGVPSYTTMARWDGQIVWRHDETLAATGFAGERAGIVYVHHGTGYREIWWRDGSASNTSYAAAMSALDEERLFYVGCLNEQGLTVYHPILQQFTVFNIDSMDVVRQVNYGAMFVQESSPCWLGDEIAFAALAPCRSRPAALFLLQVETLQVSKVGPPCKPR